MVRSVFYCHLSRLKNNDGYDDTRIRIKAIYDDNKGRYGYRRICLSLRNEGYNIINHKTVPKLMSQMGLKAKQKKRYYHSCKGQIGKVTPNAINRNFSAERLNQKWVMDVSQICINDEKLYISPILDMYNREIIAYTLSRSPNQRMVTDMLKKAFKKYKNLDGWLLHSDQSWLYQHTQYQKMLKNNGIIQSMSRKGNCLDNATMENFFGLMENELLYVNHFESLDRFETELKKYIVWYNTKRIKLRLKGMSLAQYRAQYYRGLNNH